MTTIPGEYRLADAPVIANANSRTIEIEVVNTGDRPIQVGSHFHFFEANKALRFDRSAAFGMRLNVPAGTAVRFEPGDMKRVRVVAIGGAGVVIGLNGLTDGATDHASRERSLRRASDRGFQGADTFDT